MKQDGGQLVSMLTCSDIYSKDITSGLLALSYKLHLQVSTMSDEASKPEYMVEECMNA